MSELERDLPSTGSLSKWLQQSGLDQAGNTRRQELLFDSPM